MAYLSSVDSNMTGTSGLKVISVIGGLDSMTVWAKRNPKICVQVIEQYE